jgi:BolA protein
MSVATAIRRKLEAAFAPERLEITDESHLHRGHLGARPEEETHFRIEIEAAAFAGLTRMERHRRVHAALTEELGGRVHALSIHARAPGEPRSRPI